MEINKDAKNRMASAVKKLAGDLAKVRTGRASLSIFENVKVDYYGASTPITQLAGIANPEPNLITIQPFDHSQLGAIEKAVLAANLGFTPSNDGNRIRIVVPPLTEERRREYVKTAKDLAEHAKTAVRNIRRDLNDVYKKKEKAKEISQDEMHAGLDEIQKATDQMIKDIEKLLKDKEQDIMTV